MYFLESLNFRINLASRFHKLTIVFIHELCSFNLVKFRKIYGLLKTVNLIPKS